MEPTPVRPPQDAARRPSTRRGVFVDLAIVMISLGVAVGAVFPVAVPLLRIPSELVLRPSFFAATLAAGVLLGGLNFFIAHRVVGSRLRVMSERMRYVGEVIEEATFTGDWSRCDPARCELPTDADDAIGTAAAAFNLLLSALRDSRAVEDALSDFTAGLSAHLTRDDLADVMVRGMADCVAGTAGALLTVRDGEVDVMATTGVTDAVLADRRVRTAATGSTSTVLERVGCRGDPAAGDGGAAAVLVTPLRQDDTVGALVTCLPTVPPSSVLRLADMMRSAASVALDNAVTHQRVQLLASTDALTGLENRRTGRAHLERAWTSTLRRDQPLGVLIVDLDHFKAVNDTHGHDAGDRVLRDVGVVLREVVRDHDHVFRSGGEEFVAVLPGTDLAGVRLVGERLRQRIAQLRVMDDDTVITVTASIGGASRPESPCASAEGLLRRADTALYDAKASGRDRVSLHPPDVVAASAGG